MNTSPMAKPERMFLTTIIGILLAPMLTKLGFHKGDEGYEYAIGTVVGGLPFAYHYAVLYLKAFMKSRHIPLPEELENPTSPLPAAKS